MFSFFRRRKGAKALAAAREALSQGRVADALGELERALELDPARAAQAAELIPSAAALGEHGARAAQLLSRAGALAPGAAALALKHGELLRALGEPEAALGAFDRALRGEGGGPIVERRAARGAALCSAAIGAPNAEGRLEDAADRVSLDCEVWSALARAYEARGAAPEARTVLRRMLRADRDDLEAQERLLALDEGSKAAAFAALWRPPSLRAPAPDGALERLFERLRAQEHAGALVDARALAERGGDSHTTPWLLAFVQLRAGLPTEARATLARHGAPAAPFGHFVQALLAIHEEQEDEARSKLEGLRRELHPFPGLTFLLGVRYDVLGDLDSAERLYREQLGQDPEDAETQLALASLLRRAGRVESARALECQAYLTDPVLLSGQGRFRHEAITSRRLRHARDRAMARLQEDPHDASALAGLAHALNRLGEARRTLELSLGGSHTEASVALDLRREQGYACWILGKQAQAVDTLTEVVSARPADAEARAWLGQLLAERGDATGAHAQLDEALRLDAQQFHAHASKGILLSMQGDYEAAERHYRAAIRSDPTQGEPHLNLGIDLMKRGRTEAAERALRFTTLLLPGSVQAHAMRARALGALGRRDEAAQVADRAQALANAEAVSRALGQEAPPLATPFSPWVREARRGLAELAREACDGTLEG